MNIQKLMSKLVSLVAVAILYVASTASAVANQNDAVILYLNDPLGSAIAAYDENGNVCWEEAHTPYGDKTVMEDSFNRASCGVVIEERGFTGHTEDYETDLVYMQQRYYDPTVGRFLSTDPIGPVVGMSKSINRYSYGGNNPYKYVDPDGRFLVSGFIAAVTLATIAHSAYVGYQDDGVTGAVKEASGYNSAKESVSAFSNGDYSGAAILAAGVAIKPVRAVDKIVPDGGTYKLLDPETGLVRRTGRSNDLKRREGEHGRDPATKDLDFEVDRRTDSYPAQRGREQRLYDQYPEADLNKRRGISPTNPRREEYLKEGDKL